jgi:hypothetical protein
MVQIVFVDPLKVVALQQRSEKQVELGQCKRFSKAVPFT